VAITITPSSASISTTEFFLASGSTTATYQTLTCHLQVTVDLTNMVAGDSYRIRIYRYINSTLRTWSDVTLSGVQATPYVVFVGAVGGAVAKWEVSVLRTAGSDRTIYWDLATTA
jgi:hypothetical protein